MDHPGAVHPEVGGALILLAQPALQFGDALGRVVLAPQPQIDVVDRVQAGGLGRDHHRLLGIVKVLVLVLDDFAHAEVGGEVRDAEDQPAMRSDAVAIS